MSGVCHLRSVNELRVDNCELRMTLKQMSGHLPITFGNELR